MSENPYLITGPALISFSGGRTSGYMLKHILDAHAGKLPADVLVAFANTGKEMPETLDFVQECGSRWGVRITWLEYDPAAEHKTAIVSHNSASRNGEPFEAVIAAKGGMLPNPVTRFCTIEMKIRRFYHFMHHMKGIDRWSSVVGLRYDESRRVAKQEKRNAQGKERFHTLMPLFTAKVTKRHVASFWRAQPFDLQLPNINGSSPMGNCDLCFLKRASTRQRIMLDRPGTADWWIEQERRARAREVGTEIRNDSVTRFRMDQPDYADLLRDAGRQADMFNDLDGESVDCGCTD